MVDRIRAIPRDAARSRFRRRRRWPIGEPHPGRRPDLQRARERRPAHRASSWPRATTSTSGWPTTAAPTAPATRCARPWREHPGPRGAARPRREGRPRARRCIAAFKKGLADPRGYASSSRWTPTSPTTRARSRSSWRSSRRTTWSSARATSRAAAPRSGASRGRCSPGWPTSTSRSWRACPMRDTTSGYRGYRREVLEATDFDRIKIKGYVVHGEMAYQAWINGFRLGEVPIHFKNRARDASKLTGEEIYMALLNFALLRFRYGFRPRRRRPRSRRRGPSRDERPHGHVLVPQVPGGRDRALHRVDRPRGGGARPPGGRGAARTIPTCGGATDEPVRFFPYRYAPRDAWSLLGLRAEPGGRRARAARASTCWRRWWRSPCARAVAERLRDDALRRGARALGGAQRRAGRRTSCAPTACRCGEPARQRRVPGRAPAARAGAGPRARCAAAGAVTACSDDLRRRALRAGRARPSARATVPYGVDVARLLAAARPRRTCARGWACPRDAFLVLALGRLVEKKGFAYLVEAAARAGRRPRRDRGRGRPARRRSRRRRAAAGAPVALRRAPSTASAVARGPRRGGRGGGAVGGGPRGQRGRPAQRAAGGDGRRAARWWPRGWPASPTS